MGDCRGDWIRGSFDDLRLDFAREVFWDGVQVVGVFWFWLER